MNDARRFETLSEAIAEYSRNIPIENRPLIRRVTQAIGISHYELTKSYIKALRRDGGPTLWIAYGWMEGFTSSQEALAAAGDEVEIWDSGRGEGMAGIWLPVNRGYERGPSTPTHGDTAEYGVCPVCGLTRTVTGACGCD